MNMMKEKNMKVVYQPHCDPHILQSLRIVCITYQDTIDTVLSYPFVATGCNCLVVNTPSQHVLFGRYCMCCLHAKGVFPSDATRINRTTKIKRPT